jgi:dolichyl-phosphate-mannose-protein mannosyltransferase
MQPKKIHFIIVGLAAFSFLLVFLASSTKSLTYDEPTFITSGYSYLENKEIKLNPEAPPFLQVLVALPLKFLNLKSPNYSSELYNSDKQIEFSQMFLVDNRNKFGEISFWSRFPIWLLFAFLVLVVGVFINTIAGSTAAIVASTLVAFSPNLIAHGQLATTDLGCTLFMYISVYTFYLAIRSENYKYWVICGVFTGIALLSKYTALLLAPIFFTFIIYESLCKNRNKAVLFRGVIILILSTLIIMCLGFGFKPELYLDGLSQIYKGHIDYQHYLFSKIFAEPVWYYYLAALLVKTPISTLLLIIISTYVTLRYRPDRDIVVYLLIPIGVIMFVCCFDKTNIGLRRILPIYPFLLSYISATYFYLKPEKLKKVLIYFLLAWNVATVLWVYPNYISYFNLLTGGARNGPDMLDNSSLDWGQDLPALVDWQKNNFPDEPINLLYFGSMNPELYGLKFRFIPREELIKPRNGIYAISTHYLIYTRKLAYWNEANLDWLKLYNPIGYAGNSIYIYKFTDRPSY